MIHSIHMKRGPQLFQMCEVAVYEISKISIFRSTAGPKVIPPDIPWRLGILLRLPTLCHCQGTAELIPMETKELKPLNPR
jgi:hypothetical protein